MKRRKILGAMGVIGISGASSAATSLYGTPVSVTGPIVRNTEPLRLMLDSVGIPQDAQPALLRFGQVWESVLGIPEEKQKFVRDPSGYLESHGMPKSMLEARDQEAQLMLALADDAIISTAVSGDYLSFLNRLGELGITSQTAKSGLKKQVLQVLRENLPQVTRQLRNIESKVRRRDFSPTENLIYVYGQLAPSIEQVAVAAVPVAIAAIVAAYVSVVTSVTVAILAGVFVSVAVSTAITASGGNPCGMISNDTKFAGVAGMPRTSRSARLRKMQQAIVQRELIGKRMLLLSPERLAQAQKSARLARLMNKDEFVLEANRQLVKDEVSIFIEAAEEVGLIKVPSVTRNEVIAKIQQLALQASELA